MIFQTSFLLIILLNILKLVSSQIYLNRSNLAQVCNCDILSVSIDCSLSSKTYIVSIDSGTFTNLTNLTSLKFSWNQIESIQANTFASLPILQNIFLDNNNITLIENGSFLDLPKFDTLYLDSNKLNNESELLKNLKSQFKHNENDLITMKSYFESLKLSMERVKHRNLEDKDDDQLSEINSDIKKRHKLAAERQSDDILKLDSLIKQLGERWNAALMLYSSRFIIIIIILTSKIKLNSIFKQKK